ncbi:MAG: type II toxin-antitoxin system RelE/ParE family toxin [Rhizobiales bacterium]|nr:type II toxin-antitoxin system RelE/ParE family toxin [Hyphomicrobiales bacterium]MDQ3560111.1 type II toxin-antitoxin system RelE/ParE family toxin [Pseudomonadota bacterium]
MSLRYSARALADLERIASYIEAEDPTAARRIVQRIRDRCGSLAEFPRQGVTTRTSERRMLVISGTPYLVFYSIRGETVSVLHVRHGKRRPQR